MIANPGYAFLNDWSQSHVGGFTKHLSQPMHPTRDRFCRALGLHRALGLLSWDGPHRGLCVRWRLVSRQMLRVPKNITSGMTQIATRRRACLHATLRCQDHLVEPRRLGVVERLSATLLGGLCAGREPALAMLGRAACLRSFALCPALPRENRLGRVRS